MSDKSFEKIMDLKNYNINKYALIATILFSVINIVIIGLQIVIMNKQTNIMDNQNEIAMLTHAPVFDISLKTNKTFEDFDYEGDTITIKNIGVMASNINVDIYNAFDVSYPFANNSPYGGEFKHHYIFYEFDMTLHSGFTLNSDEQKDIFWRRSSWSIRNTEDQLNYIGQHIWSNWQEEFLIARHGNSSVLSFDLRDLEHGDLENPTSITVRDILFLRIQYIDILGRTNTQYFKIGDKKDFQSNENEYYVNIMSAPEIDQFSIERVFHGLDETVDRFYGLPYGDPTNSFTYNLHQQTDDIIKAIQKDYSL